jgi:hypothetical protein
MRSSRGKVWLAAGVLSGAMLLAAGCSKGADSTPSDQVASSSAASSAPVAESTVETVTTEAADMVTVTYMDEDTVLKTEEVEAGTLVTAYTPEKDGSVFIDWFATPSKNHRFDFTQPITADTEVFAGFSVYKEDTREFYILGSGTSDLLVQSNWGKELTDDMKMTKTEGKNEYTLTCDILKGDQFQFAIDSSWDNKRGFGYIANPNDENGNPVFTGQGGGYGDVAAKGQNITAAEDGNYTFTLYTYPNDDTYDTSNSSYTEDSKEVFNMGTYDTITWVRNGDPLTKSDAITTYYIKGEKITGWEDVYDETTGTTQDGTKYTLTVKLEEGDVFLFTSQVAVGDTVSTGSEYLRYGNLDEASKALFTPQNPDDAAMSNMVAVASGTYTFVYDSSTGVLSATME